MIESGLNIFKQGLGRQLLVVILLLAILPITVISFFSYELAKKELYDLKVGELKEIAGLQSRFLDNYIDRVTLDINIESELATNTQLLSSLVSAKLNSKHSLNEFVKSYQWFEIVDELALDITIFHESAKQLSLYHDVLLIDPQGNILFSLAKEDDFGTNLFKGKYQDTAFAKAAIESFESGQIVFSDFEFYAPSDNILSGFMINVLLDEYGNKIGLFALQIYTAKIDLILNEGKKTDINSYLLGSDLVMRTNPYQGRTNDALMTKVDSNRVKHWINESDQYNKDITIEYTNAINQKVLASLHQLNIANKTFITIAEEDIDIIYAPIRNLSFIVSFLVFLSLFIVILVSISITRKIVSPIVELANVVSKVAQGDLKQNVEIKAKHEIATLAEDIKRMLKSLARNKVLEGFQNKILKGERGLNEVIRGSENIEKLSHRIISYVCMQIDANVGILYIVDGDQIKMTGTYAFKVNKNFKHSFLAGEGLVGEAVLDKQTFVIAKVPQNYFKISSGLGEISPKIITIVPILIENEVVAVLELGSLTAYSDLHEELLDKLKLSIGFAINTSISQDRTQELLKKTQTQAEELTTREEELSESNILLEAHADELKESRSVLEENNEKLQAQQEELRATNDELAAKARELEEASIFLEDKNTALNKAKQDIEHKAKDLALSSQYKSEFLANMSHELRTPLNSILILSKLMADNREGNLDDSQIEYASTINASGSDLLILINDILDLSKIEAGRMDVHWEGVNLIEFIEELERKIKPLADKKEISFKVKINKSIPKVIESDGQKLEQVLKNLLSNAFKFTQQGTVSLNVSEVKGISRLKVDSEFIDTLKISVIDTGIGIPKDKQKTIFDAFKQADGSTERKYGGTGLGLSISREISKILGGRIEVKSKLGEGSTFSILIPIGLKQKKKEPSNEMETKGDTTSETSKSDEIEKNKIDKNNSESKENKIHLNSDVSDDRQFLEPENRSILIVEDDNALAKILVDIARERGFKALVANDGETGLYLADYYKPSGIILDVDLPLLNGNQVITRLKESLETRHIPVHFISSHDDKDVINHGAIGFLSKPVSMDAMNSAFERIENIINREVKSLLVIEDNEIQAKAILELIGDGDDVKTVTVHTGKKALEQINRHDFDCIVLDLGLPDMTGVEFLESIRSNKKYKEIPIVVYTGKELHPKEKAVIEEYAQNIIIKSARSPEKLLDNTALFLHRVESKLPKKRQEMIRMLHDNESVLKGRKAVIVDDDMRNIFALSSVLQEKELEVIVAKNGVEALKVLDENKDADIVLMDIMMPEMDGYEAMRKIRLQAHFEHLPIIALTAKAMKGDRAECIDAGASDYLAKPVDIEKLLSMMRVWLYR